MAALCAYGRNNVKLDFWLGLTGVSDKHYLLRPVQSVNYLRRTGRFGVPAVDWLAVFKTVEAQIG